MRTWIAVILISIGLFAAAEASASPIAKDGTLDLRDVPLETSGPVALKGEWLFDWLAFRYPDQDPAPGQPMSIRTPATWGSQSSNIGDHGYGTYRLNLILSERDVGRALGLDLPSIASAFELYVNGVMRASTGMIGTSRSEMSPAAMPQPLYFHSDRQEVQLVLLVSNFVQRKGGVWAEIRLGTAEQIAQEREQRTLFQAFVTTGLLLMGLYHLGYFFVRPEPSTLYFGLSGLGLALRSLFVGDMLAVRLLPHFPWEIAVKIEYLSVFWGIAALLLYFHHLYEDYSHRKVAYGLALTMIAATLPILALPARAYTEWKLGYELLVLALALYIVYSLVHAAIRRKLGARLNLTVGLLFLATVLNDILYYNFLIDSGDLVTLGLLLFVFTQPFMVARKFAAAFREVERLKKAQEGMNERLEAIVEARTDELRKVNMQLKSSERSRSEWLSNVTHELGNPLTTIIGYLRRVKEGISGEAAERHIDIAYRKALSLNRLLNDLRQLSLPNSESYSIRREPVRIEQLCDTLGSSYDWKVPDRQVVLALLPGAAGRCVIDADLDRIGQVFANLVANALSHTSAGDRIEVVGRSFCSFGAYAVIVRDSGPGIRREERRRIFDRYYRVQGAASRHSSGTGLGLSISKSIIEAHGGRIGVLGEYGEGSAFYFLLPMKKVD
ncbi:sensor histidine kinase [Paenibacillus koleovorans]|uniref:sensor histidine kinase n=1 Tax=Paenibacillus koleovorans TaxID=121608 RepID=UPI000FD89412|nr:sensor histidine kinase [Paenibacillus koleovorans]